MKNFKFQWAFKSGRIASNETGVNHAFLDEFEYAQKVCDVQENQGLNKFDKGQIFYFQEWNEEA